MVRKFCDRVVLDDYPINMHHRDEILKLQSLILNIIRASRFKNFLKYCWKKGGYLMEKEDFSDFIHPVKYCFPNKCRISANFFM